MIEILITIGTVLGVFYILTNWLDVKEYPRLVLWVVRPCLVCSALCLNVAIVLMVLGYY
ncbi:hypothetical protein LCGC14_1459240 [marine sediment metagenome]|uniref:Uncharacterized protein n=1 Tax=marine sediment metagenome TaxID=412755 RepID=A0A0F9JFJ8_9ZZZZ